MNMKLLTRLREPSLSRGDSTVSTQTIPDHAFKELVTVPCQLDSALLEEHEHTGIGAAMPQDIVGLNFMDNYRKKALI
jgi:hypothetical protein